MVVANISPAARAAQPAREPERGAEHRLRASLSADSETRSLSQTDLANRARAILHHDFPGVEARRNTRAAWSPVFFANLSYPAPIVVEIAGDDIDTLDAQARLVAEVAQTVGGIVDVRESMQVDYPEVRVETDRAKVGLVGASLRSAAQTTLQATIGNINTLSALPG